LSDAFVQDPVMKKVNLLAIIIGLGVAVFCFASSTTPSSKEQPIQAKTEQPVPVVNCKYGQCQAIAASTGQQCRHCVSAPGDLYCWQHKDNH
jgi:hypothetical protein